MIQSDISGAFQLDCQLKPSTLVFMLMPCCESACMPYDIPDCGGLAGLIKTAVLEYA
jgi:hypothetical protein